MNPVEEETLSKIEVLADLEPLVVELMAAHEAKRVLWFPAELLEPPPGPALEPPWAPGPLPGLDRRH